MKSRFVSATSASSVAQSLSQRIKTRAGELGFDLCGITSATTAPHADFFAAWIAAGRSGEMSYLARHVEKRCDPRRLHETGDAFASILVLGVDYHRFELPAPVRDDPSRGLIAAYAWGDDYHEIVRPQLYALDEYIRTQTGRTTPGKCLVDTGPVLERDWAAQAGLGFTGKNCCTIFPGRGSWLILAVILVPEPLDYDPPRPILSATSAPSPAQVLDGLPPSADYGRWEIPLHTDLRAESSPPRPGTCGACTRCLDACPTDAFVGPFHLDPQRCISYWTIEARGAIPRPLRARFGNRIFGCDICQEVCPWNQRLDERTPQLPGLAGQANRVTIPLLEGFASDTPYWLDVEAFRARFRRSPIKRAKRGGMLRNVCVALGNWGEPVVQPALSTALYDPEAIARMHAAWALGEIIAKHAGHVPAETARATLEEAAARESDSSVLEEIHLALQANADLR